MSEDFPIRIEQHGGVAVWTIDRVDRANALSRPTLLAFGKLAREAATNPSIRAIIVTGAGDKAFCAGADLKERDGMSDQDWAAQHKVFEAMGEAVLAAPMPVIAAVNGAAFGGGCEIALLCDFLYAADTARFALPEVTLGIMPGLGATQTLARAAGPRRAKEVIASGRPFTAAEALAWGVANRICPQAELLPAALETAGRIAANAPLAIAAVKRAIDLGDGHGLKSGMALELEQYGQLFPTEDRREGVRAWREKRKPSFSGG